MSHRIWRAAVISLLLAATVACGTGGGGTVVLPNPQGNYSNASLNGS